MNKDATWAEDFKRKIKDNINYAGYVLKHKSNIIEPMTQMNLPYSQALAHDLSKFRPKEFGPYRDWFFGPKGRTALEPSPEVFSKWRSAVRQHYKGNAHHWKKLGKDPNTVPLNTRMETVADWYAVGKTLRGSRGYPTFKNWYTKRRDKLPIDPTTKTIIDYNLGLLKTSNFIIDKHTESPIAGLSKSKALKALIGQKEGVTVPMGLSKSDVVMNKVALSFGSMAMNLKNMAAPLIGGAAKAGMGRMAAGGAVLGAGMGAMKKNDQGQRGNIGSIIGGAALGAGAGAATSFGASKLMSAGPNAKMINVVPPPSTSGPSAKMINVAPAAGENIPTLRASGPSVKMIDASGSGAKMIDVTTPKPVVNQGPSAKMIDVTIPVKPNSNVPVLRASGAAPESPGLLQRLKNKISPVPPSAKMINVKTSAYNLLKFAQKCLTQ